MPERSDILTWLHIGDLHITNAGDAVAPAPAGVGAWPEKGIFDTQPGPNRNGRKW